jgi:hypothetical protein
LNPFLSKSVNRTSVHRSPNSPVGAMTKNTSFCLLGVDGPDDLNNSNIFERASDDQE